MEYKNAKLQKGSKITINLKNGKKVTTKILKVIKEKKFINGFKNLLISVEFDHTIIEEGEFNIIEHRIIVNVKIFKFLEKVICNDLKEDLKNSVESLAKYEL